jgi:hypothetical protein
MMVKGDFLQYPIKGPFKEPEHYKEKKENIRKNLFWVRMMQPGQPFEFAKDKMLYSKPICWTNFPEMLSWRFDKPVETIEET